MSGRVFRRIALVAALCCLAPALPTRGAPPAPADESRVVPCAECGMSARISGRYTARMVSRGATLYFCDIGDLVAFIGRTRPKEKEYVASVRDFPSGEWIDARAAFFVVDKKKFLTPMTWGIAAFRDREAATGPVQDFPALLGAQR